MDAKAVKADNDRSQGKFVGVGMVLGIKVDSNDQPVKAADGKPLPESTDDGYPIVKQVMTGGPAKQSGLKIGDAIKSIDGKDTRNRSLDDLIGQIRGEADKSVTFQVRHKDGTEETMTITRKEINIPAVTTKKLPDDIGYLRLEGFDQYDATDEFKAGLTELKDSKALIVDLRGNPGGFVHNSINISSLLMEQGTIVTIKTRIPGGGYQTVVYKLTPTHLVKETSVTGSTEVDVETLERQPYMGKGRPVVVLINGNSASASEMTTGAWKDNNVVTVIGTRSFGKGIGQSNLPMPNGTRLHVTSLRYFTPNGTWLGDGGNSQVNGIEPNIEVPAADDLEFGSDNDNQLQKAVDVLTTKLKGGASLPFIRSVASRSC